MHQVLHGIHAVALPPVPDEVSHGGITTHVKPNEVQTLCHYIHHHVRIVITEL